MSSLTQQAKSFASRFFVADEQGSVAIIFGVSLFALTMCAGVAVDYGRVVTAQRSIGSAADAAALAAAKRLREGGANDADLRALAQRYLTANLQGTLAKVDDVTIDIDRAKSSVSVNVAASVPMTLTQIAGFTQVAVPATAVALYDSKDIEIGLQLDVTGSMCSPCSKLQALKDAVGDLLDVMMPNGGTTNSVRVGLAPFASGVNAGDYALAVSNNKATNGCVYERHNLADQPTELLPTGVALSFRAKGELTPPKGFGVQDCPSDAKVMAMTSDKAVLKRTVNSWKTSTSTAGHLGAAWAWYLVSPEWAGIWPAAARPAAYKDGKTLKVVVLMTDGIYNTVGGYNMGDTGSVATQSKQLAADTCDAMKAKGVVVYTVGFQAPSAAAATLEKCASDSSKFFDAKDADGLRGAFKAIAVELNTLRLSR